MKNISQYVIAALLSTTALCADGAPEPAAPAKTAVAKKAAPAKKAAAPAAHHVTTHHHNTHHHAAPAHHDTHHNGCGWGLEAGVQGGVVHSRFGVQQNSTTDNTLRTAAKLGAAGGELGLFVRALYNLKHDFVVGCDLSGGISRVTGNGNSHSDAGVNISHKVNRDYFWGADLVFGRRMHNVTPYLKAGFASDHWKFRFTEATTSPIASTNLTFSGLNVGLGMTMELTSKVNAGLELSHVFSKSKTKTFGAPWNERMRLQPSTTRGMMKISYKFM